MLDTWSGVTNLYRSLIVFGLYMNKADTGLGPEAAVCLHYRCFVAFLSSTWDLHPVSGEVLKAICAFCVRHENWAQGDKEMVGCHFGWLAFLSPRLPLFLRKVQTARGLICFPCALSCYVPLRIRIVSAHSSLISLIDTLTKAAWTNWAASPCECR